MSVAKVFVADAQAASVRILGHEDTALVYEILALQLEGALSQISTGFIRGGSPTAHTAKPPHVAVDENGVPGHVR